MKNYIIHDTPFNTNFYIWKRHYFNHIQNVFFHITKIIDINSQHMFDNFCIFLYKNSSNYICKNI